jgi:hypothetical protein
MGPYYSAVPYDDEEEEEEEKEMEENKNKNDTVIRSASTYSWVVCHLMSLKQLL